MVEKAPGYHGGEILYVGDHIFTDVSQSKVNIKMANNTHLPRIRKRGCKRHFSGERCFAKGN